MENVALKLLNAEKSSPYLKARLHLHARRINLMIRCIKKFKHR